MGILASFGVLATLAAGQMGGDPGRDFVLVGEKAYGLFMPVQVCCPSIVTQAAWTGDGNYALFLRQEVKISVDDIKKLLAASYQGPPPDVELSIVAWSRKTGKTTSLWHGFQSRYSVGHIEAVPGSGMALVEITETMLPDRGQPGQEPRRRDTIVELDPRAGATRVLASGDGGASFVSISVSHSQPLAVMILTEVGTDGNKPRQRQTIRGYRPGSPLGNPVQLDPQVGVRYWTEDGKMLTTIRRAASADPQERKAEHFAIDPFTGKSQPLTQPEHGDESDAKNQVVGDLSLFPGFYAADATRMGGNQKMRPVLLRGAVEAQAAKGSRVVDPKEPGALVSSETQYAEICPTKDGVLYVTRGVALYRAILDIPKDAYLAAKAAAEKAVLMSNAKQIALGALLYANDHDDMLPGQSDWQSQIAPYLKNDSLFSGFNYTFQGGSVTSVERPAETELGYFQTDGGRIVAYLDGHVQFKPDK